VEVRVGQIDLDEREAKRWSRTVQDASTGLESLQHPVYCSDMTSTDSFPDFIYYLTSTSPIEIDSAVGGGLR
jgi:hypothetical protein